MMRMDMKLRTDIPEARDGENLKNDNRLRNLRSLLLCAAVLKTDSSLAMIELAVLPGFRNPFFGVEDSGADFD
jgi:hypothetical protein